MTEAKLASALGLAVLFALGIGAAAFQKQPSATAAAPAESAETAPAPATASAAAPTPSTAIAIKSALSRDDQIADGIATFIAYDHSCVTMPDGATRMAYQALEAIPLNTFKAATQRVAALHNSMGPSKWCAAMKPIAERAMSN